MTATGPVFDPARSAALRDILHETVATSPARPPRTRFAILGGLIGVAVLLAGGTAALALSGVLHFGAPAPAPAPTTVTPSVTPIPTPTPTATTPRVEVSSGVIVPHDVDALPGATRWALDLPGLDDGCRMSPQAYDLNDGLAVFLSGMRPKEYEGGTCADGSREERIGLTLVDTTSGEIVWQRTWDYVSDASRNSQATQLRFLGTSGRAMIVSTDDAAGAHDVIDLTDGRTVATIEPKLIYGVPVPGDSGDLLVASDPADGRTDVPRTISRIDPRDPAHPRWTTTVEADSVSVGLGARDGGSAVVTAWASDGATRSSALIDFQTGQLIRLPAGWEFSSGLEATTLWRTPAPDGTARVAAVDDSGRTLWSRPTAAGSYLAAVGAPGSRAGSSSTLGVGTDKLVVIDRSSVTLVDQTSGDSVWTASLAGCDPVDFLGVPSAYTVSAQAGITVLFPQDRTCTFDAASGRLLRQTTALGDSFALVGERNIYSNPYGSDTGTAYDAATGAILWTRHQDGERWMFAGGYLVQAFANRVESIG
ncbi:PQQ-binding-like beta-propeller repeat protein [Leifsonia sp. ZF2019]|uniref:outer membrane protein assembly factor BamB family protein n=1 Tax=Leifsonia sp. ZF2019 TaxID=2781978 RepID=UPI001CBC3274|nr:PQQ-binding-like beta-propeller repeat protein [Leifsonia sp. ZF2019]UAJ80454.1 PQQ-binding-like beta-propeller repeat protein [Leifsonia sp. ZF2019]